MKKIFATILAALCFVVAFATENVERKIEIAFQTEFPDASHASWRKIKKLNLYTVRFVQGNEALMAYFDMDGNYLALARSILEENLPAPVKKSYRKINSSGALATAEKINIAGETSYLFYFKEGGHTKAYQINEGGGIKRMKSKNLTRNL